jgi:hypothetical protein
VRDQGARGQETVNAVWAGHGAGHDAEEKRCEVWVEEGVVGEAAQQGDHSDGLGIVAILELLVIVEGMFVVTDMDGGEGQGRRASAARPRDHR